jgi:hypothetical protein
VPAPVGEVPGPFREEGEAIFDRWRAVGPAMGSAVSLADRYDKRVRLWSDLERFAAAVGEQAATREEHTYAAMLGAWVEDRTDAYRVFAHSGERALAGLIEQLVSLGSDVPEALVDAHREELASLRRLHREVMVRDPEATRQAALAFVAVKRDVIARERAAFGMTRRPATRSRR